MYGKQCSLVSCKNMLKLLDFLCSFVGDSVIGALSKINVFVSIISFVATNVAVLSKNKSLP